MNAKTGSFSEASSSQEEDIGMRQGNTNEELNRSSSEQEVTPTNKF